MPSFKSYLRFISIAFAMQLIIAVDVVRGGVGRRCCGRHKPRSAANDQREANRLQADVKRWKSLQQRIRGNQLRRGTRTDMATWIRHDEGHERGIP